ncbi:hypothetical protein ZOSMA_27G00580 [Zostera marina]|uniref:Uncharacterized protein n=1 Tax=Zostera marina TaxID=29655 RepID=A0A0K9PDG7_ZOSMR|nr:hypothetical protein ZOSMA_27G00580 [Zostera marina]
MCTQEVPPNHPLFQQLTRILIVPMSPDDDDHLDNYRIFNESGAEGWEEWLKNAFNESPQQ